MLTIHNPVELSRVTDPHIRSWLAERFQLLGQAGNGSDCDADPCWFALIESGDDMDAATSRPAGFHLLMDVFGEYRYGEAGFVSPYEWVAEHAGFYEAVIVYSDSATLSVIVPKASSIDPRLLQLLAEQADCSQQAGDSQ